MVRYTGRQKTITGAVNTNQVGLKMSGCPSRVGRSGKNIRFLGRRVNCMYGLCGPTMVNGAPWRASGRNFPPYCRQRSTACAQAAGGVGHINSPYTRTRVPAAGKQGCTPKICTNGEDDTPLPLFSIIDTDVENTTVEVQIGYSSHQFSSKSMVTYSNMTKTSDFNNILLVGSTTTQTNPDKTISLKYGLPLIIYRKDNINHTKFINKLNENFNFHPHGLACDAFVDGASALNEFGSSTQNGDTISLKYPIVNNSMFSAWHPHPMFNSSPLLYGNLIMPYIVKDLYSDYLEPYFILNKNDIPIYFSTIDCDNSGKLNSARLYSYPCVNLRVHKNMKEEYPNISSKPIENNDNIINYCSSLGGWRGTFLQINGQITGAYTPNKFCQNLDDSCSDNLFCRTPECTDQYTQLLTHEINHNLLRLRLVHAGSSFRRSYFGFIDDNNNFLDFWVIGGDSGFDTPWITKMISLESMNRTDVIIDITQGLHPTQQYASLGRM